MSTMLVGIYDALKEAGASEEKARAAATSLTGRDHRRDEVDQRFQRFEQWLGTVQRRLDLIEQAVEALTARVAALEEKVIASPGRRRDQGRARSHEVDARHHDRRRARAPGQRVLRI